MINATEKFKSFLTSLKDESNTAFLESVEEGFSACFEDASTNPDGSEVDPLKSSEEIETAIVQTKKEGEVLTKLNNEQKEVEIVKSELEELNKTDPTKPVTPTV